VFVSASRNLDCHIPNPRRTRARRLQHLPQTGDEFSTNAPAGSIYVQSAALSFKFQNGDQRTRMPLRVPPFDKLQ
jgi:hypothetical protein